MNQQAESHASRFLLQGEYITWNNKAGVHSYIIKPFTADTLLEKIMQVMKIE